MRLIALASLTLLALVQTGPFASQALAERSETGETPVIEAQTAPEGGEAALVPQQAIMTVSNPDGRELGDYVLSDYTASVARSFIYDTNEPRGEVSFYISIASPIDRTLLEWAHTQMQAADAARSVTVRNMSGTGARTYEMEGARVTSLSLGSAMEGASLQISAQRMVVDGVALN